MTPPRAAVVVCTDPGVPVFGDKGASVHLQEVLRELVRRCAAVHVITVRPGGDPPPGLEPVIVHPVARPTGATPAGRERATQDADRRAAAVLAGLARRVRVGLVYQRYALWSAAVGETARRLGLPTVLEINTPLPEEQATHRILADVEGAYRFTGRALAAADAPFAVSGPVARWAERLDPRRRHIPVVGNGVDPARFAPAANPPVGTSSPVVVFSGTFQPWHGLDLLVAATARARAGGPGLRLLLIGDGPRLRATVEAAERLAVPVATTGRVAPEDVPALLTGADVAVAPYPAGAHHFSPLKVAEYLAAGLPTVASAIADLPGLVVDGTEALLVAPGDVDATGHALARLAGDPALRQHVGAAARRAALERFSWAGVVDRTLGLLTSGDAA